MKNLISFSILLLFFIFKCSLIKNETGRFQKPSDDVVLAFSVTCDMRDYSGDNPDYFRGVCERLSEGGPGTFMISPGDIDPPEQVYQTIKKYIQPDYLWYPVVGNHESETPEDMAWLREYNREGNSLPNIVRTGPAGSEETTFSFDYGPVHFAVINQYYNGFSDSALDGYICDSLFQWLINDLTSTEKEIILVAGHEPAYPLPDETSGRFRHEGDCLNKYPDNRDRFWETLSEFGVKAYLCGHTHNYSIAKFDGVWQVDAGHARGTGDTGAQSTLLMFYITADHEVWVYTYRLNFDTNKYGLSEIQLLD